MSESSCMTVRPQKKPARSGLSMERAAGIEPATLAWKARALPLCNARARSDFELRRDGARSLSGPRAADLVGRAGFEPA